MWADSGPTLVAQEAGNSSNCPDNGITLGNTVDLQPSLHVPVEHFGDFDTSETVSAVQEYQAQLLNSLRSQLQKVFNRRSESEIRQEALGIFDCFKDLFAAVSTTYRQDPVS